MNGELIFILIVTILLLVCIFTVFIIGGCIENKDKSTEKEIEFSINVEGSILKTETIYVD